MKQIFALILFMLLIGLSFGEYILQKTLPYCNSGNIPSGGCFSEIYSDKMYPYADADSTEIHFLGGKNSTKNDFGGMFISNPKSGPISTIQLQNGSDFFTCSGYIEGYYRNPLRGDTFYPLTQSGLNFLKGFSYEKNGYNNLSISGMLLTDCDDKYAGVEKSIYGQLDYFYNSGSTSHKLFSLQAGRQIDLTGNNLSGNNLVGNFQVYQYYYPAGFIYDSSYGVGLVGGKVETGYNELFTLVDQLNSNNYGFSELISSIRENKITYKPNFNGIENIVIRTLINLTKGTFFKASGVVSISKANLQTSKTIDKLLESINLAGDQAEDRVVTKSAILNISSILNIVRQSSSLICRNNWINESNFPEGVSLENRNGLARGYRISLANKNRVLCFDTNNLSPNIYITENLISNGNDTIIVMQGSKDNKIFFETSQFGDGNLNLFLEPGLMLLSNDQNNLINVGSKGIIDINEPIQYSGTYMKGRYYINGLLAGFDNSLTTYNMTGFNHKLVIEGGLASLNTIDTPSSQRQSQVFNTLGKQSASDGEKQNIIERIPIIGIDGLNIGGAVSRKCIKGKYGTDGTNCTPISENENFGQLSWYIKNSDEFAPLLGN